MNPDEGPEPEVTLEDLIIWFGTFVDQLAKNLGIE